MIEFARKRQEELGHNADLRSQYSKLRDGALKPVIAAWRPELKQPPPEEEESWLAPALQFGGLAAGAYAGQPMAGFSLGSALGKAVS